MNYEVSQILFPGDLNYQFTPYLYNDNFNFSSRKRDIYPFHIHQGNEISNVRPPIYIQLVSTQFPQT